MNKIRSNDSSLSLFRNFVSTNFRVEKLDSHATSVGGIANTMAARQYSSGRESMFFLQKSKTFSEVGTRLFPLKSNSFRVLVIFTVKTKKRIVNNQVNLLIMFSEILFLIYLEVKR